MAGRFPPSRFPEPRCAILHKNAVGRALFRVYQAAKSAPGGLAAHGVTGAPRGGCQGILPRNPGRTTDTILGSPEIPSGQPLEQGKVNHVRACGH